MVPKVGSRLLVPPALSSAFQITIPPLDLPSFAQYGLQTKLTVTLQKLLLMPNPISSLTPISNLNELVIPPLPLLPPLPL